MNEGGHDVGYTYVEGEDADDGSARILWVTCRKNFLERVANAWNVLPAWSRATNAIRTMSAEDYVVVHDHPYRWLILLDPEEGQHTCR